AYWRSLLPQLLGRRPALSPRLRQHVGLPPRRLHVGARPPSWPSLTRRLVVRPGLQRADPRLDGAIVSRHVAGRMKHRHLVLRHSLFDRLGPEVPAVVRLHQQRSDAHHYDGTGSVRAVPTPTATRPATSPTPPGA